MDKEAVTRGVQDSFDFYLSQHPITVVECIEDAVKEAMNVFLVRNREDIIERIAQKLTIEK